MLDIAIIGAGAAGLSAAINAAARNKSAIVLGREIETTWLYSAENVNNHLGFENLSGKQLMEKFLNHTNSCGVPVKFGRVLQIVSMGSFYTINFDNEFINAKTIIFATGISKGKGVKGEAEFLGKGVSYCATCDGMLYKGKDVIVVGEIEEGEHDANFLHEICKKVYYVHNYEKTDSLKGDIIRIKGKISEVFGEKFVSGVVVNGEKIFAEGVFVIKGVMPATNLLTGLEMHENAIKVGRFMETNLSGVFAAGDCTGKPFQLSKAVGEGLIAAQQAVKFIAKEV